MKNQNEFPKLDSLGFSDEMPKQKLAYPYEYFNLQNMQETLQLKKDDYWSPLTHSFASDKRYKTYLLKV